MGYPAYTILETPDGKWRLFKGVARNPNIRRLDGERDWVDAPLGVFDSYEAAVAGLRRAIDPVEHQFDAQGFPLSDKF